MKKEDFRRLKLKEKYRLLQDSAPCIASRFHGGFHCLLYDFSGYYVEVWKPVGINLIQWIEVVNRDEIIDSYLKQLNVKDL